MLSCSGVEEMPGIVRKKLKEGFTFVMIRLFKSMRQIGD